MNKYTCLIVYNCFIEQKTIPAYSVKQLKSYIKKKYGFRTLVRDIKEV
jgi:hypothetical protein